MKTIVGIFCLLTLFASPLKSQKVEEKVYKTLSSKSINNLDNALKKAEGVIGFSVFFPTFIPVSQESYAYIEIPPGSQSASISFSFDETCQGMKICTVGSIYMEPHGVPEQRKDMSGKLITTIFNLSDNIKGYYTPGHSMGDYWPPSLQWSEGNVLYDLWWTGMDELTAQEVLVDMANSAIHQAAEKKITD